ncbi:MAG TPA: copper-binding protein [Pyrinomonadaceae bacterium]|nr:copper-binding protein [Pyrinomonadaceae bacterium]
MARKGWLAVSCLALTFVCACGNGNAPHTTSTPTPAAGPAAAVQTNQYKGQGVVKALNPKAPSIEIDHGDIGALMPAMQMEFPVTDGNLLNGLAVNDRIDFTVENAPDGVKVVAIKKK